VLGGRCSNILIDGMPSVSYFTVGNRF
jgi:hypothetical protein